MKKTVTLALLMLSGMSSAQQFEDDPFAELDAEISEIEKEGSEEEMAEFQKWKDEYLAEYQKFREEHFGRMDDIRDNLISLWGEAEQSDNSKYVEYSDSAKTVFDFEKNELRISLLHEADEEASIDEAAAALTKNLSLAEQTATEPQADDSANDKQQILARFIGEPVDENGAKTLIESAQKKQQPPQLTDNNQALLAQQLALIDEQTEAQKQQIEKLVDLEAPAEQAASSATVNEPETDEIEDARKERIAQELKVLDQEKQQRIKKLQTNTKKLQSDSDKRQRLANKRITTFTIPLKNKKHAERAQPYVQTVKQHSQIRDLSPSLLLALMHTESYFNPRAQSHIPAYGLMQIVPQTAGRDVNRFIHNKDENMAVDVLYQPTSNIEAGAAYMYILYNRYLKNVSDPLSRLYCSIAAYNTGAGNVARTFNADGSRNVRKAAKIINQMQPQDVYDHLIKNLPYEETRNYLKKVTDRRSIYTYVDQT